MSTDQLLDFLDHLCLDETLYWRIPLGGKDGSLELAWKRTQKPNAWSVRKPGEDAWTFYDAAGFLAALPTLGVDRDALDRQLGASILTQAVFADMVMEGAVKIFGSDAVQRSIKDTRDFLQSVSDAATRMTRDAAAGGNPREKTAPRAKGKAKLRLVDATKLH